jgi:hypothetical protein
VSTDFIEVFVRFSKGSVKGHEGTKASKDSAAASEAASYPLAVSNGLAPLALPPAVSPSPPRFHHCLQGSRISPLSPISHFEAHSCPFQLKREGFAAKAALRRSPPYPEYNIVIYNLLLVPLQGSPNILLFASTLNVLLPYDNVDTIDALFVA